MNLDWYRKPLNEWMSERTLYEQKEHNNKIATNKQTVHIHVYSSYGDETYSNMTMCVMYAPLYEKQRFYSRYYAKANIHEVQRTTKIAWWARF